MATHSSSLTPHPRRRGARIISVAKTSSRIPPLLARLEKARTKIGLDKKPWPVVGATVAGAAGVALTAATGAGEIVVGAAIAYATYRVFREGLSAIRAPLH